MYDLIRAKLATGDTIILDGGTGTDIQRRGVPMSSSALSGPLRKRTPGHSC